MQCAEEEPFAAVPPFRCFYAHIKAGMDVLWLGLGSGMKLGI